MKMQFYTVLAKPVILALLLSAAVQAEPRSGYEYIKPETRAMQDDDFANPGLLKVDHGNELFNQVNQHKDKACASCHGEDGSRLDPAEVARYPVYDDNEKAIITLQMQIQRCSTNITDDMLPINHPDLVALETFVRHLANGEKVNVTTSGAAVNELLNKGEELYKTRFGLIDMSCYHCHGLYPGQMIRGQKISQGQGNGFPAYRLDTGEMANLGQRIQQCMTLLRAEPFAAESDEIRLLQLYIMSRSNGLVIETPAVRY